MAQEEAATQQTNAELAELDADPSEAFFAIPDATRAAVKRVRPSLVTIESFGGVTTTAGVIGGIRKQGEGNTTGIVISEDGLVVTSLFNFANSPRIITVILADGKRQVAKMLGKDLTRNLCLLKIDDVKGLPTPEFIPLDEIEVGRYAISLGVGYGDQTPAMSLGIISAKNRIGGRAIQTDANTSPANYGGPLIDIEGRIFGVCVPLSPGGLSASAGVEWYDSGIGFAIPLDKMDWWVQQMKDGIDIFPGIIGVTVLDNPDGAGVQVVRAIKDSAAAKVGLKKGDILLEVNGSPIKSQTDLQNWVKQRISGDQIKLLVRQGQDEKNVTLILTPHPDSQPKSLIPGLPPLEELR